MMSKSAVLPLSDDIAAARAVLEHVVRNVRQDSTAPLTREAYAVLRFNTQYLLHQLQ